MTGTEAEQEAARRAGREPGRSEQEAHPRSEMVVLAELADSLIADLRHHPAGRTAKTVLSGTVMRAVVIALQEGAEMAEHDSPSAATLYVIKGKVTLRAGERDWTIYPGQLIPVPPQRHAVLAHTDSAILLTVALH
ncbi:LuxR family transcriptional regulator [Nocardioides sp. WL0053]|uniref:LuxR family transcriptional regulator n=1 Tax=Nocardioides jiangsuensis TaxID=2866161 RepID=A0ABS7RHX5_9ACTN|nr:LuxR family transcriptional regulator [Nocardioides jiangsuensis]MBY9074112.1 LuxR family transcriptional regulator [Nocardioides jiangsuensis]